jgi:hypothetical protein
MLIGLITFTITISLVTALLWMLSTTRRDQPVAQKPRYHCVCVEAPGTSVCCARCEALRGRRFLVKTAPPLPVPGCTAEVCTCRYVHFVDRRAGASRRRQDRGHRDSMPLIADRRLRSDRRHARPRALA